MCKEGRGNILIDLANHGQNNTNIDEDISKSTTAISVIKGESASVIGEAIMDPSQIKFQQYSNSLTFSLA
jgi:hypothetical protein